MKIYYLVVAFVFMLTTVSCQNNSSSSSTGSRTNTNRSVSISTKSKVCYECHNNLSPGIVKQWENSSHAEKGVGCYECHSANKQGGKSNRPDAFFHMETANIVTIVTPKDCGSCHAKESKEFQASYHAKAGDILGSLDNTLGSYVEGSLNMKDPTKRDSPALINGCQQCHGSIVAIKEKIKTGNKVTKIIYDSSTWPNTGMGRKNLDGSTGTCTACHSRHGFSRSLARYPDNCGKCHMGPDHPQREIYDESKHGIAFDANIDNMNMNSKEWIVGKDYWSAPTCATCHMSAYGTGKGEGVTHDIGKRISWTLRPPVSIRWPKGDLVESNRRRANMQEVCKKCHSPQYVIQFYEQFDSQIQLYNNKYARPGIAIMEYLKKNGHLKGNSWGDFDEEIDYIWFELWHHEGRRARHGASMMGPDYTQWHGNYELAKNFYTRFIPKVAKYFGGERKLMKWLKKEVYDKGMNDEKWAKHGVERLKGKFDNYHLFFTGLPPNIKNKFKKQAEDFKKRYVK